MKRFDKITIALCAIGALVALAPGYVGAQAQELALAPKHTGVYDNMLALRYNPIGLEDQFRAAYQYRLYDDPGQLWNSAYLGVALTPTFNPAVTRLGGRLEIQPLAVLQLHAGAYWVAWHGTFDYLQSYPSVLAPYSDQDLKDGTEADRNYSTTGTQVVLGGRLQVKVGHLAIRDTFDFFRSSNDLHSGDRAFYDPRLDVMVGNGGWHVENDFDVVWVAEEGWLAGLRTHLTHAWYDQEHLAPGEKMDNPNTPILRAGLLAGYVFDTDTGPLFQKPTVLLIVNWYLAQRYRTGEETSQALPYVGVAFRFNGTLW